MARKVVVLFAWLAVLLRKSEEQKFEPHHELPATTLKFGARLRKPNVNVQNHIGYSTPTANVPVRGQKLLPVIRRSDDGAAVPYDDRTNEKRQQINLHSYSDSLKLNRRQNDEPSGEHHLTRRKDNGTSSPSSQSGNGTGGGGATVILKKKPNLIELPNLQLNRIEPFWPFSNVTSTYLINNMKITDGHNPVFPHANLPERFKDTTFFFSHVGPNSFEYRAQFHHNQGNIHHPKDFNPFVDEFPEFPKLPPIFQIPDPPEIFPQKPKLPPLPDFNQFPFQPVFNPTKRVSEPSDNGPLIEKYSEGNDDFKGPLKTYNRYSVVLGEVSSKYPKIFKFNEERINIEEFEREKKQRMKLNPLYSNGMPGPDNVQRSQLLILHGGIFTVKEPPLYQKKVIRKRRQRFRNTNNRINKY